MTLLPIFLPTPHGPGKPPTLGVLLVAGLLLLSLYGVSRCARQEPQHAPAGQEHSHAPRAETGGKA